VAALLLDVHTHELPDAVAAAQAAKGSSKPQRLAVNSQNAAIQDDQSSIPAAPSQHICSLYQAKNGVTASRSSEALLVDTQRGSRL